MKIPGVRRIVAEMCKIVRGRRDGTTIWINPDPEPTGPQFEDCWDLIVKGDSDQVANLVNLRKWDDPTEEHPEAPTEYTDSDLEKVVARQGEVKVNVPPSPTKKSNEPAGVAVITPPHSQSGESQLAHQPKPTINSPVRIKLLVGAKSESAEKEQKSRQIQATMSKPVQNPASSGRKLKDVLGKNAPAQSKTSKRPYNRKNAKSMSDGQKQTRIEGKTVKSRATVEVLVPSKKSVTSPRKEVPQFKPLSMTEPLVEKAEIPLQRMYGFEQSVTNQAYDQTNPEKQTSLQKPSKEQPGGSYYGGAMHIFQGNVSGLPCSSNNLTSNGSTPALISGSTSPHASPGPQTPPGTSYGSQYGSCKGSPIMHNRRETISPKGSVPRDMMRLLN